MDPVRAFRVVIRYESLEAQLVEFLKHVPPQGSNMNAWSPTVATIIKEACSLLETILKWSSPTKAKVRGRVKKRKDLSIEDLAILNSELLGLAKRKVIWLTSPPEYRTPYDCWVNLSQSKRVRAPAWWTTHNRLKHDEISFMEEATVNMGIDALAGLILAAGSSPEMTRALMQRDLLHWRNVPPHQVVTWALGGFPQGFPIILKTTLFAILLGGPPLPDDINEFRPAAHTNSPLLVHHFVGRF